MKSQTIPTKAGPAIAAGNSLPARLAADKVISASPAVPAEGNHVRQEWLRVSEACRFSRLSKPKLYDLINRGLIRSVSMRERGQIKGTRLISYDSLRALLESRATGGTTPTA